MLLHYFKIAVRSLLRHRSYSAINIAGLAVGVACSLLITLYIRDELSYDRFHPHADRTYRLIFDRTGSRPRHSTQVPQHLGQVVKELSPEIVAATEIVGFVTDYIRSVDRKHPVEEFFFVDPAFFDVFSFPFLFGDPQTALEAGDGIVITEEVSDFFFPGTDPLGKTLWIGARGWTVTGVVRLPYNTHFTFKFLARRSPDLPLSLGEGALAWNIFSAKAYLILRDVSDVHSVEARLNALMSRQDSWFARDAKLSLQPLADIHLRSHRRVEFKINGDIRYIYLLGALALLLTAVTFVNFVNLTTARYTSRAREVGVRKVFGAHQSQLVRQFLGESVLTALLAGVMALTLAALAAPLMASFTGKQLRVSLEDVMLCLFLTSMFGLFAGSYPAFFLSSFRPTAVLKGVFQTGRGDLRLRRTLIAAQIFATLALSVGAAVVYAQLRLLQESRLGAGNEPILIIDAWTGIANHYDPFKAELLRESFVASVAAGYSPGESSGGFMVEDPEGGEPWLLHRYHADYDYFRTLGIEFIEGRSFSPDRLGDAGAVILTESAARKLGLDSAAVGHYLSYSSVAEGLVIGVVEDFSILSYREPIAAVAITLPNSWQSDIHIRIESRDVRKAVERIEEIYNQFRPDSPMVYTFLDDTYDSLLRVEHRFGTLFSLFSLAAVATALLGLLGLAGYLADKRTKEVATRRVMGATSKDIVWLLSREFIKPVLVTSAVVLPVVFVAAKSWLENFPFRISLTPELLIAGATTVVLTLLVVSAKAYRASLANPAENLRCE